MVFVSSFLLLFLSSVATPSAAPAAAPAQAEAALPEGEHGSLLAAAAKGLEAISNLEAKFTQVAPSGTISTGKLYLSRPGRLRFEYDEPSTMLIVATGGLVYVHDSDLKTTDSYPVGQTPLRFLLAKELDLDAAQVLSVEQGQHGVKIILAARDEDLQGHLALLFEPGDLTLQGWSFVEANGDMTLVNLEEVEEKKRLPSRLFRVPEAQGLFLRDN